jgi:GntR family transcriptional regulator
MELYMTIGSKLRPTRSGITRYHQLAAVIRGRIAAGNYGPSEALPSENALARAFGFSTETVRRALYQLEVEGLIDRMQGRGTFVRSNAIPLQDSRGTIPLELLLDGGSRFPATVISISRMAAQSRVASVLGLLPEDSVLQLSRIRRAGERAVSFSRCYVGEPLATKVETSLKSDGAQSLLTLIESAGHLRVDRVEEVLEATAADSDVSDHLGVPLGSPIMTMLRVYHSAGTPVNCGFYYWRGDSVRVVVEFRRPLGNEKEWVRSEVHGTAHRAPRRVRATK